MISYPDAYRILHSIAIAQEHGYEVFGSNHPSEIDYFIAKGYIAATKSDSPNGYPWRLKLTRYGEQTLNQLKGSENWRPVRHALAAIAIAAPLTFLSWWLSSLGYETIADISWYIIVIATLFNAYFCIKADEDSGCHSSLSWWSYAVGCFIIGAAVATCLGVRTLLDNTIEDITQRRYDCGHELGYNVGYDVGRSEAYEQFTQEEYDLAYLTGWFDGVEEAWADFENEYGIIIETEDITQSNDKFDSHTEDYDTGYNDGYSDGYDQGYSAGNVDGYLIGRQERMSNESSTTQSLNRFLD